MKKELFYERYSPRSKLNFKQHAFAFKPLQHWCDALISINIKVACAKGYWPYAIISTSVVDPRQDIASS